MHLQRRYTDGEPQPMDGFKRFHNIPRVPDQQTLLQDPEIDMILTAGILAARQCGAGGDASR